MSVRLIDCVRGVLESFWFAVLLWAAEWRSKAGRQRVFGFRPCVEGLEERWCPSVVNDHWKATQDNNWSNPYNWSLGFYPSVTDPNNNNDVAVFDNLAPGADANCTVDINATCYGVSTFDTYSKTVTIAAGKTLNTKNQFSWGASGGTPILSMGDTASKLQLDNTSGPSTNSNWTNGSFSGAAGTI
jgi:hypothetical protein